MEHVKAFSNELQSLHDMKPPISRAKMSQITKTAMRAIKYYKHIVQSVEKFIQKCRPEYKVPGLYVIDSIVRQSRHQYGPDKDLFVPRFTKSFCTTFQHLFKCPDEDKSKIVRVLNLWQKNGVLPIDVIQPLLDLAKDPMNPAVYENAQREIEAASAKLYSSKKSSTDVTTDAADGACEVPQSEARSKPAALIESITALLVQQSQQPISAAAAVAAQQMQQQLHSLQRQLLHDVAIGVSEDSAAVALANLERLAEQLLQQHGTSSARTVGGSVAISGEGDGSVLPPPSSGAVPGPGGEKLPMSENGSLTMTGRTGPPEKPAFNSKLLDYDYGDSDEDMDHGSPLVEDHEVLAAPVTKPSSSATSSSTIAPAAEVSVPNTVSSHEHMAAQQQILASALRPYQEAAQVLSAQPVFGFPGLPPPQQLLPHHPTALIGTYNGQAFLQSTAGLARPLGAAGTQHPIASGDILTAGALMSDGRIAIGSLIGQPPPPPPLPSAIFSAPPLPHVLPPPVPHGPPPVPEGLPPVPQGPPPAPTVQPPLPPPPALPQNDVTANEDVDYRTDMDYRVLRDRDERDRNRDDRGDRSRDGRRRSSRSPRRHRSPERDSGRHRRSRSRERRDRSPSREREELERKRRDKERERRHQGLPPLRDKCFIVCSTTLWIGHLSKQSTENDLRRELEQHGPVQAINLIPPRGCAYVCMASRGDAARALDKLLKGVRLHNNLLKAAWASPKAINENLDLKSFWDVDRGCAYVPFDRLPSDLGSLNGEGGFVDEESLPSDYRQSSQRSSSPAKEDHRQDLTDAAVARPPITVANPDRRQSPSAMQQSRPLPVGLSVPGPHPAASQSHQMPHALPFALPGFMAQPPGMPLLPPHGRVPPLMPPHGGPPPAGVAPPLLGMHPSMPGLIPGSIGGPLPVPGSMFATSSPQRLPTHMALGLMSLSPHHAGVPPPSHPASGLPPHLVLPLSPALHPHVTQVTAGPVAAGVLPLGPKDADAYRDDNPQLAKAIEHIVSNAASIQAVVQAAAAAGSATVSSAVSNTPNAGPAMVATSSNQVASGAKGAQVEGQPSKSQAATAVQASSAPDGVSDEKASVNKPTSDDMEGDSEEAGNSAMSGSFDEDEDDGGANSMGGPTALHHQHRQHYPPRGQAPRSQPPRPPTSAAVQHFQPDGRRLPQLGQRSFPPPSFQGPPPSMFPRPLPPFGLRPPMHDPHFDPRMMMPPGGELGVPPPPFVGIHGPPPPLGLLPHGPPPFGVPPHGLPPPRGPPLLGPPPQGPPPQGPPGLFETLPTFDGAGHFHGIRDDVGFAASQKPMRKSRWQESSSDSEALASGDEIRPLPSEEAAPVLPSVGQ